MPFRIALANGTVIGLLLKCSASENSCHAERFATVCDLFDSAHTHRNAAGLLYESRVWLRKKKLLNGEFVTSYESNEDSTIQASKDACNDRM